MRSRFLGSPLSPRLTLHARAMRSSPTPSERILWLHLRNSALGVRFRRQVPLDRFIVDFFAPSHSLAIEVDGASHPAHSAYDVARDARLASLGVRTLRFKAWVVERDTASVIRAIRAALHRG
jgi:very-short-patch-repair endonuclease